MTQPSNERPNEPGGDRPRAGRLAQGLLIAAIVLLIAIALVTFN